MRKDLFKTLFARMLATYLTVIFLLLLLVGITVSNMFRNQYIKEEEDKLRKEAAKINTILVEQYGDSNKREAVNALLRTIAQQYDAFILWIDVKGDLLSSFDRLESKEKWAGLLESVEQKLEEEPIRVVLPGLEVYPSEKAFKSTNASFFSFQSREKTPLMENGKFYQNLFFEISDMPTLTFIRALMKNNKVDSTLIMSVDMHAVNMSINRVYMDVLLIALLAVVVAILAVYYLTTRITKPIVDMNVIVRRYSKGSFDLRLNDQGADEVAQLAKSFNIMAVELATLEQTRRSFVANVSHELRSPLTSISGFLEAIQDGTIAPKKQGEYIALVIAETKRMTRMVNNLLDLARMESGQSPICLMQFDINELALRTLLTFEARINQKEIEIALDLHEPHCYVEADQNQIAQVLRNLIDNAIKFSPEKGKLAIKTELIDRKIARITVKDSGKGIPQEDITHIFKRFYKAEKAHTPSAQSGTGLGLSIVKAIIDHHEQDIFVESREGEGAAFIFTLKYVQDIRRKGEPQSTQKMIETQGDANGI